MAGLATIQIAGRLPRDPETKNVGDTSVTTFTVSTSKKNTKAGTWEYTNFNCKAWGKTGEIIAMYVRKGHDIVVAGEITSRQYEKDGQRRDWWEVDVRHFSFGPKNEQQSQAPKHLSDEQVASHISIDDDIPF